MRLVLQFLDRALRANGHAFFLYLTNAVQMSAEQQQSALLNPDIARAIAYADPPGKRRSTTSCEGGPSDEGSCQAHPGSPEALGFTRSDDPFGRRKWSFTHAFSPTSR